MGYVILGNGGAQLRKGKKEWKFWKKDGLIGYMDEGEVGGRSSVLSYFPHKCLQIHLG